MNQKRQLFTALSGLLLFALPAALSSKPCDSCCACSAPIAATGQLSSAEAQHLLFMREEEKLARDVYLVLGEKYNQRVLVNIPRAEQRHMDAVLYQLKAYELDDPILGPGNFSNQKLQRLYDDLTQRGSASSGAAYQVGALIEEVDIADLMEAIQQTKKESLRSMYENLLGGSKRHLNAFVRNYEKVSGKTYRAQKLSQAEVDGILGR